MVALLGSLGLAVALAGVFTTFSWLARRIRRRGLGGALMGPLDEAYHPAAHRSRFEVQVQAERMIPTLSPGDRWVRRHG